MNRQQSFGEPERGFVVAADGTAVLRALGYTDFDAAWRDRSGRPERTTPHRWTLAHRLGDRTVFRKVRSERAGDARNEWRRAHELTALGLTVPEPLALGVAGRRSVILLGAVPGRPVQDLLAASGPSPSTTAFVLRRVVPVVATLHGAGFVHRDLYWNHLFAEDLDPDGPPVGLIDVERVFRPRWRRSRWVVKDLAGLLASWPGTLPWSLALRGLRALGHRTDRAWLERIARKARRIRDHRPKYRGDEGPRAWA